MAATNSRRYRIAALLNKGPSGRIYRAVLEEDGRETDIAIKMLRDEDVAAVSLARLREEARLAGMVEDRALVRVEQPVYLQDRWAIVMDLITGVSLQRLTSLGAVPPSVVCEVVGEVARVLDKVWSAPGPNGKPLRIMHRDIKPSNLQVNSAGRLRVLDFGIAKPDYRSRDPISSFASGAKSLGLQALSAQGKAPQSFISPERLEGDDTPAGDIYSLGATALVLMGEIPEDDGFGVAMAELAGLMTSEDPRERPSASDVASQCAEVLQQIEGVTLREWAERNVSKAIAVRFSDELVGKVLAETDPPQKGAKSAPRSPPSLAPGPRPEPEKPRGAAQAPRSKSLAPERLDLSEIELPKPEAKPEPEKPRSAPSPRSSKSLPPERLDLASSAPVKPPERKPAEANDDDEDETMVVPSEAYLASLEDAEPEPRPKLPPKPAKPQATADKPDAPRVVQRVKPPSSKTTSGKHPSLPPAFEPALTPEPRAEAAPEKESKPGRKAPRSGTFPKGKKSDDDETVVLPSESYLSLLDTEPQPPNRSNGSQKSLIPHELGLPPRVPKLTDPDLQAPAPQTSRGRYLLGMAAMGMGAASILLTFGIIVATGAWWLWPEASQPSARARVKPPTVEISSVETAMSAAEARAENRLTVSSIPLGVDVYLDRKLVGQTPVVGLLAPNGLHTLVLVSDYEKIVRKIEVGKKKPIRYVWKGGEIWEEHL